MVFVNLAHLDKALMQIKEHALVELLLHQLHNAHAHNIEILITVVKNVIQTKFKILLVLDVKIN
jgi:CTP:phosphocholine cytidylyltransferase-like protein